jgi:hypothetical protein
MPPYDYTNAPPPQFDLIPHGTIATVVLHIRAGGVGEDDMLKRSKDGGCEMLDCEFVIADGPYKGRKFWEYWVLEGSTEGHAKSKGINRGTLKAILDSALGLKPDDVSPQARAARTVSLKQFEGMTFIAKIGIEKGGARKDEPGNWPDKNILAGVITPDRKEWHPVEQPPPSNGGGSASSATPPPSSAPPIARPGWAS